MMKKRFLFAFILFLISVLNTYAGIELRSRQMKTSDGLPMGSHRWQITGSLISPKINMVFCGWELLFVCIAAMICRRRVL